MHKLLTLPNQDYVLMRVARASDYSQLTDLQQAVYGVNKATDNLEARPDFPGACYFFLWVLEHEQSIIAWLGIKILAERDGGVELALHPDFQGKGLGQVFLSSGIEFLRLENVFNSLKLAVLRENIAAIQLYRKLGFKTISSTSISIKLQLIL
jgi:[ribosomal protein S18]-alanine N-acetyltransferase